MPRKLDPDALQVESFDTMQPLGYNLAAGDAEAIAPATWEQWKESCCYICRDTGPTLCDWCSTNPPVYPPSDPRICAVAIA